ncbi:restriction endonuclease [Arthrobacter sp. KBS0703]|uniref:restriction endonuclease n=1 Tax=Arthrobacter sp. KBS0703 TaxID=1955698 RepID=UPI0009900605|nr:restriction endonuclease [Arthrobacter sp. KBS0703]TSE15002.1 restriction endonuclease [Arthrobacter sp. KBS0703]
MAKFRSSRHDHEILLADWLEAEELAAWYMREDLGMSAARVTGSGNDRGIDVVADSAVAQVKHVSVPVGAPVVQAALGAGHGNEAVLFFSLSGYTRQAEEFAARAGVCLFQYDIYGDVRARNDAARELVANRKSASSAQDTGLNQLRAKAAPALARLETVRRTADTLATSLEHAADLGNDDRTLALITGLYAQFYEKRDSRWGYPASEESIEAGWAELVLKTVRGNVRVSRAAVDAGVHELIELHDELGDLDRLRQLTAAQWLRALSDWEFRWNRARYLMTCSYFPPTENEPPLETFELEAVIDMSNGGKFNHAVASRWIDGPTRSGDPENCFAAAQIDPVGRGADYCLRLLEDFWGMDFSGAEDGKPAYPLGWSQKDVDSLRRIVD